MHDEMPKARLKYKRGDASTKKSRDSAADRLDPPRFHRYYHHLRVLRRAMESVVRDYVTPETRVLDFGCGEMPYQPLFVGTAKEYVGADLPGNDLANVTILPDGRIDVPDKSWDMVLSSQVLEHVVDPGLYLSESFRVTRPGGLLALSTHGHWIYHPDPHDYWRWTVEGLRKVVEDAGYEIVQWQGLIGVAGVAVQMFQDASVNMLPVRLRPYYFYLMQRIMIASQRYVRQNARRDAQVFLVVAKRPDGECEGRP